MSLAYEWSVKLHDDRVRVSVRSRPGLSRSRSRYAHDMATEAASAVVTDAATERVGGGKVSRPKALLVATIVGFGAGVATYKLLRSGGD